MTAHTSCTCLLCLPSSLHYFCFRFRPLLPGNENLLLLLLLLLLLHLLRLQWVWKKEEEEIRPNLSLLHIVILLLPPSFPISAAVSFISPPKQIKWREGLFAHGPRLFPWLHCAQFFFREGCACSMYNTCVWKNILLSKRISKLSFWFATRM